jgi:hypothetical protein
MSMRTPQPLTKMSTRILTYLLTELRPFSVAANCAASQELPSILWNPNVQYRVHVSRMGIRGIVIGF